MPWEGIAPRVPSRSGGMVVVQTGILGTLAMGVAMAVFGQLTPAGQGGVGARMSETRMESFCFFSACADE